MFPFPVFWCRTSRNWWVTRTQWIRWTAWSPGPKRRKRSKWKERKNGYFVTLLIHFLVFCLYYCILDEPKLVQWGKSAASLNARLVNACLEAAVFWGGKGLLFGPTPIRFISSLPERSSTPESWCPLLCLLWCRQTDGRGRSEQSWGGPLHGLWRLSVLVPEVLSSVVPARPSHCLLLPSKFLCLTENQLTDIDP